VLGIKRKFPFSSFETFTAVMFQVEDLWVVTPCSVVGTNVQGPHYTASNPEDLDVNHGSCLAIAPGSFRFKTSSEALVALRPTLSVDSCGLTTPTSVRQPSDIQ